MIAENLRLRNELDNSVRENRDDGADKAGSFCVKKRALFLSELDRTPYPLIR